MSPKPVMKDAPRQPLPPQASAASAPPRGEPSAHSLSGLEGERMGAGDDGQEDPSPGHWQEPPTRTYREPRSHTGPTPAPDKWLNLYHVEGSSGRGPSVRQPTFDSRTQRPHRCL